MARMRFKHRTTDLIKAKYVGKKAFKIVLIALGCTLALLGVSTYRLYVLGDFNAFFNTLTTKYTILEHFIKGLF
jgi:hypothetical protein